MITSNVYNFDVCGSYLWVIQNGEATLLDTLTSEEWIYGLLDGIPGSKVYDINCDEEWVWFLTSKGIAFYNWRNYHYE